VVGGVKIATGNYPAVELAIQGRGERVGWGKKRRWQLSALYQPAPKAQKSYEKSIRTLGFPM